VTAALERAASVLEPARQGKSFIHHTQM
jgi:hypothetical protein